MTSDEIDQALETAVAQHQQGDLAGAEEMYRRVLQSEPDNPDALHLLGMVTLHTGRHQEALDLLNKAIEADPETPEFYLHLGVALDGVGRVEDAIAAYRRTISMDMDNAQALCNLGGALCKKGQAQEALEVCRRAIELQPTLAEAHNNLGNALRFTGQPVEAIVEFRLATTLRSDFAEAYGNLGAALLDVEPTKEQPDPLDDAVSACRQAIALRPDLAAAHLNLGSALLRQYALVDLPGTLDEAILALRKAAELRPDSAEMQCHLTNALYRRGDLLEAMEHANRGVELKKDLAVAHWYRGVLLLTQGELEEGWPEYEWRWHVKELRLRANVTGPKWDGSDLAGKRIFLYTEQGYGDAIQFARFIPRVTERGGKIVLACAAEMRRLLEGSFAVEKLVLPREPAPEYDVQASLMSLPMILKTNLTNIPATTPYLKVEESLANQWRERVKGEGRLKVGLAWAGRPTHPNDRNRSIPLVRLAELAKVPNVGFYSLQKGEASHQAASAGMELTDWTRAIFSFADAAALIDNLDLVISVDTATAHLAGAMGKPVWLLLPKTADWRWMVDRQDSPWYPKMRLFRQTEAGDWATPIGQIRDALGQMRPA